MTMIMLAVFCKCTGRKGFMLYVPVVFLLCSTFTSPVQSTLGCITVLQTSGMAVVATSGLQLVFAILLMVLGVIVAYNCLKEFFTKEAARCPTRSRSGRSSVRAAAPMPTRRIPPPTPRTLRHKVCTS